MDTRIDYIEPGTSSICKLVKGLPYDLSCISPDRKPNT